MSSPIDPVTTTGDAEGSEAAADHDVPTRAHRSGGDQLRGGRHGLSRASVESSQRERLMAAMITATVELGYAKVTVDELAKRARTAKRTFYAMFPDKEACLLHTYDEVMSRLFASIDAQIVELDDPRERVRVGVAAAVEQFTVFPEVGRFLLVECIGASPAMASHRAQVIATFAAALTEWQEETRRRGGAVIALRRHTALATVGAIVEPITMMLIDGATDAAAELIEELTELVGNILFEPGG